MPRQEFKAARDLLLALRENYDFARSGFKWPRPKRFNWALDWFDAELAAGEHGARPALKILGDSDEVYSFAELSAASNRVANGLRSLGAKRGDRLLLMLGNVQPLWVAMLAAIKLGLVVIPATTMLAGADIADRLSRGRARFVIADARRRAQVRGAGRGRDADRDRGRAEGLARICRAAEILRACSARTGRRRPTIRCCSISPPARPRARSSCCTAIRAIRSAISRPCSASG